MRDLEDELRRLYEDEAEKKEHQMRQMKEENMRIDNLEKQVSTIY